MHTCEKCHPAGLYSAPILIGSFLSLVAAGVVIGTYRQFEELRRHPNGLVLWKCILDVIFALTTVIEGSLRLSGRGAAVDCAAVSFFIEFSLIGSELCFFLLSFDLFTALRNPFVDYKSAIRQYRVAVFVISSVLAAALIGVRSGKNLFGLSHFGVCWVDQDSAGNMWAFFYAYLVWVAAHVRSTALAVLNSNLCLALPQADIRVECLRLAVRAPTVRRREGGMRAADFLPPSHPAWIQPRQGPPRHVRGAHGVVPPRSHVCRGLPRVLALRGDRL